MGELNKCYNKVNTSANLVLNTLSLYLLGLLLLYLSGFSIQFIEFTFQWICIPAWGCSIVYYRSRYGLSFLEHDFSLSTCVKWFENWLVMTSTTLFCWTQMLIYHLILLQLEPLLPSYLQGCITFEISFVEDHLRTVVNIFHISGLFLLLTLPLWVRGFYAATKMVDSNLKLTYFEAGLEIVYQTSHAMSIFIITIPLALIQIQLGLPFHIIHLLAEGVIMGSLNRIFRYKFSWQHQLAHQINPLYQMTHIEHHLCKGIYSTTSPAGLWEGWLQGGSHTFSNGLIGTIPWAFFQGVFTGFNIVSHTMWPVQWLQQWHPLHHVSKLFLIFKVFFIILYK